MQQKTFKSIFLLVLSSVLFSFSTNWGGDSFQIYLNKKLVLKDYVHNDMGTKSFSLDKASTTDQVDFITVIGAGWENWK
jgi:hypothetical protein